MPCTAFSSARSAHTWSRPTHDIAAHDPRSVRRRGVRRRRAAGTWSRRPRGGRCRIRATAAPAGPGRRSGAARTSRPRLVGSKRVVRPRETGRSSGRGHLRDRARDGYAHPQRPRRERDRDSAVGVLALGRAGRDLVRFARPRVGSRRRPQPPRTSRTGRGSSRRPRAQLRSRHGGRCRDVRRGPASGGRVAAVRGGVVRGHVRAECAATARRTSAGRGTADRGTAARSGAGAVPHRDVGRRHQGLRGALRRHRTAVAWDCPRDRPDGSMSAPGADPVPGSSSSREAGSLDTYLSVSGGPACRGGAPPPPRDPRGQGSASVCRGASSRRRASGRPGRGHAGGLAEERRVCGRYSTRYGTSVS